MDNIDHTTTPERNAEQEIDLVEIIKRLWSKRKFILKVAAIFACFGLLVALCSPKVYTAGCTMVPQTGEKNMSGNLGGLAAMAGINLGGGSGGDVLSPKIYPKILTSVPFQKELMQKKVKFEECDQELSIFEYFTNQKYQKFSLLGTVKKYTIGLPGVILGAFRSKDSLTSLGTNSPSIQMLSEKEKNMTDALKGMIALSVNDKDGIVQLSVDMAEPLAAAQLAQHVQELLQRYITEFKIQKVQSNLDFVNARYAEVKQDFQKKQLELAEFRDANRSIVSAVARTNEEKLTNEYSLSFALYSELAKQREQANIQVKENTPIFTIVEPVTVPNERSKPKRSLILIAFTFLGGVIGIGLVLTLPFLAEVSGNKRLAGWLAEDKKRTF